MPINPPVMPPSIILEIATSPSPQELAGLHAACFDLAWSEHSFAGLLAGAQVVTCVARSRDGTAAGFAMARIAADEAEILTMGVLPGCRRQGLGRKLITQLCALAGQAGARSVFLEVREANAAAIALYRTAGFRPVALRKEYYRDPDGSAQHAVVMRHERP